MVFPAVLLCAAALTWSIAVRLKDNQRLLAGQARGLKPVEILDRPVSVEELTEWRARSKRSVGVLIQGPQEMGAIINELERKARELGWRVETNLKAALPRAGGFEALTLHPVQFRLDDESTNQTPAYDRLIAWLRVVSSQSKRMEIAALHVRSAGAGLAGAEVDLQLFSYQGHEGTAAK